MIDVIHGDARDVLPRLDLDPTRTVVITDPPWPGCNIPIDGGGLAAVPLWRDVAALVPHVADRLVLWLGSLTDPRGMVDAVPLALPFRTIAWMRYVPPAYRGPFMGNDVAYVFGKTRLPVGHRMIPGECTAADNRDVLARRNCPHPCPRPMAHARWLLRWHAAKAATIVDPFCGSGTTLAAAAELGLNAIGIDSDARWVDYTRERVRTTQGPLPGLEERGS